MLTKRIQDTIAEIKQQLNDAANSHPGLTVLGTVQGGIARIEADLKDLLGLGEGATEAAPAPEPEQLQIARKADEDEEEHEDHEEEEHEEGDDQSSVEKV